MHWEPTLGARVVPDGVRFRVWAPHAKRVTVALETPGQQPRQEVLKQDSDGFHTAVIPGIVAGDWYRYRLDDGPPLPDPASRLQPEGVHGPSVVVDWRAFPWSDGHWSGLPLEQTVLYELHVGTFTPGGTFTAAAERLPYLKDLGVTAVELMPVADFPGRRNWGYDGVALFAPARCYGHPDDLRRLVDAAHQIGLAVHLDVVYNHLGPDGAYQPTFSRFYRSEAHTSPWGAAMNFDGTGSQPVRDWVIENALHWIHEYHLDGLRLDATHTMTDGSGRHILAVLTEAVRHALSGSGRRALVIAEDQSNDVQMLKPEYRGGFGLDAVWSDDFHHEMRRLLARERNGQCSDFSGSAEEIALTASRGWFYSGQHSNYFGRPRGTHAIGIPSSRFVFYLQNHDQIGNWACGNRLHHRIDLAAWRAASLFLLVLPETPLLFMGQEWAAGSPFHFFTDHPLELGRVVGDARRREFAGSRAYAEATASGRIPDPQADVAFFASRLDWSEADREPHASVRRLYRDLLELRREEPTIGGAAHSRLGIAPVGKSTLIVRRRARGGPDWLAVVCFSGGGRVALADYALATRPGTEPWTSILTTEDPPYAPDCVPIELDHAGMVVSFSRPGAVIFRTTAPQ
jgi:maltooligosyltrehalose trehalohydrolase